MTDPHDTRTLDLPLASQRTTVHVPTNREKCLTVADKLRGGRVPVRAAPPTEGLTILQRDGFQLQDHRIQIGPLDI